MSYKLQIKEVAEVIAGMAFSSRDADPDGTIPVLNASVIKATDILSDFSESPKISVLPQRSPAIVKDRDILIVSRAVPNSPFKSSLVRTTVPLVASSSLYILRLKNKEIDPEYFNYFLNSKEFQRKLIEEARGSTISHITRKALSEIEIPIPDKNKQKAIVDLTTNVNKQNKIHARQIYLKEKINQAAFSNINTI